MFLVNEFHLENIFGAVAGHPGAAAAPAGRQVGQEELLPAALLDLALALQPPGHRGHV